MPKQTKEWIQKRCVRKRANQIEKSKTCCGCSKELPAASFGIRKVKSPFDGEVLVYLRSQCRDCETLYSKEQYHKDPKRSQEKYRASILSWRYGISREIMDKMLEDQENSCGICRRISNGEKDWHIDHDHETGVVRGLLCTRCNTAIGFFEESEENLLAAISYLQSGANYGTAKSVKGRDRKKERANRHAREIDPWQRDRLA